MVGILLFQINVPVQTAQAAIVEAANCGFELQPRLTYSPDLISFYSYSFINLNPTCVVTIFEIVMR